MEAKEAAETTKRHATVAATRNGNPAVSGRGYWCRYCMWLSPSTRAIYNKGLSPAAHAVNSGTGWEGLRLLIEELFLLGLLTVCFSWHFVCLSVCLGCFLQSFLSLILFSNMSCYYHSCTGMFACDIIGLSTWAFVFHLDHELDCRNQVKVSVPVWK